MEANTYIKSKKLDEKQVRELLKLKSDDIDLKLLQDYFAFTEKSDAKFNVSDYFTLSANKLYNKKQENTTVGRYIFNLFLLNDKIGNEIGYMNYPMTDKMIGKLDNQMSNLLLNDKITTRDFADYIDKMNWFCYSISKFVNCSFTTACILTPDNVKKRKEELIEENKEKLEQGDMKTVTDMENELIELSKEALKDLPDLEIYDSGARGSFKNNYKNTSLMRGCIKSVGDPTKITVSTSSLEEGIPPEELHAYADILTTASYSRAVGTQDGGYEGKKLSAAFQNTVLDEPGSNCHSKRYLEYLITKDNYKLFLYRYIVKGNTLVMLTEENKGQFINKVCKIRSPLYCTGDKICNVCAGNLYYKLGIKNVGLITNVIGTRLLNISLKAFHDLTIKLSKIDIDDYID